MTPPATMEILDAFEAGEDISNSHAETLIEEFAPISHHQITGISLITGSRGITHKVMSGYQDFVAILTVASGMDAVALRIGIDLVACAHFLPAPAAITQSPIPLVPSIVTIGFRI